MGVAVNGVSGELVRFQKGPGGTGRGGVGGAGGGGGVEGNHIGAQPLLLHSIAFLSMSKCQMFGTVL